MIVFPGGMEGTLISCHFDYFARGHQHPSGFSLAQQPLREPQACVRCWEITEPAQGPSVSTLSSLVLEGHVCAPCRCPPLLEHDGRILKLHTAVVALLEAGLLLVTFLIPFPWGSFLFSWVGRIDVATSEKRKWTSHAAAQGNPFLGGKLKDQHGRQS
ncbi:hypothetical protein F5X68DRAFT_151 [Plectosphaerella plurivora]|uniref:Uncharacterized protein n=1 Tax=Plectosphaerella plurivora TaxID=936078 RepID=A0A9P8VMU1_9PEZI|nr:hypothetical protein F5X68DRAFT_151 [Plectosphaerella plurivora]